MVISKQQHLLREETMRLLQLIVIIVHFSAHAYATEKKSISYITTCIPQGPNGDCGFGIFNDNTCECNCIPPYCFDELYQSCVSVRFCYAAV